jgi:hypothetical protein
MFRVVTVVKDNQGHQIVISGNVQKFSDHRNEIDQAVAGFRFPDGSSNEALT